jgi:hypothetical protein
MQSDRFGLEGEPVPVAPVESVPFAPIVETVQVEAAPQVAENEPTLQPEPPADVEVTQ